MCLIIKTDTPKQLTSQLLETAYNNNSDGFGVMFCNQGKLHTQKIVPKTFKDIEKLWSKYNNLDVPMGLHFRFNTNGDTARSMSHPFQILSQAKGDNRDMWVMHNGPQLPTPMIDNNKSDTHQFVKWVLRPQLSANPQLLYNAEWQNMIEETIGSDKLLFLDGKTKEFVIYNEDGGKTMDNIGWLSNTYSIQPTSYGSRNYTYDFDTNKMAWKNQSWWCGDENNYSGMTTTYGKHHKSISQNKTVETINHTPTTHYDNKGELTHTTYAPNHDEYSSQIFENMYNGKEITWQDICYLDNDELIDLCEENPKGTAKFIQEMILGGKYD